MEVSLVCKVNGNKKLKRKPLSRRPSYAWLHAFEADLKPLNIGLSSAWKKATIHENCGYGGAQEKYAMRERERERERELKPFVALTG